uniref:EGF-like domain-containing protein n=1 Tax=Trichogramma kaykai TaxID=54128 RepID=A0ABD2X472_9HYME
MRLSVRELFSFFIVIALNCNHKIYSDIDECAEGTHNCGKERCYNLPGSFQCAKAVVRPVRKRITPTTRMSELTTDSQIQSTTESHYCDYGYKYNATIGSCVDVDECVERKEVCSPTTEECENSQGGYSCRCRTGFRRDNETKACLDINECLLQNACNTSQRCDNTIGSYTCIRFLPCGTGYTLNAATELCEDDDECVMGTHDCSPGYRCRNTLGSFRCDKDRSVKPTGRRPVVVRPPPFLTTPRPTMTPRITTKAVTTSTTSSPMRTSTKASVTPKINSNSTLAPKMETTTPRPKEVPDKKATKPVSKTKPSSAPFTPFSSNTSTPRPRPKCPPGFETGPIGQCMDVDECQQNPRVCGSRKCINTIGSFNCDGPVIICPPGYAPDFLSGRCKDVDECLQGTHKCGEQQTCENRPGGYVCYCPRGYEVRNRDCVDVNECERGRPCGSSKCLNAPGSYRCLCEAGFENDATGACQDIDECSRDPASCQHECYNTWGGYRCGCKYGYRLKPDNRTCVDVDECAENKGLCHGICDNTPGSYRCTCPKGYLLEADGHTCTDIDECKQENVCKNPGELCQNLRGGHRCNKIDCPAGYIIDKNRKNRCIRETPYCSVHDKACFQRPAHYTYNYIAIVSMFPIPVSTNQVELFTMRGAYNLPGATMQFSIAFIQARAPPHVQPATESYFALRRPFPTQAVLVMTKSLQGPQDIELEFAMEIYAPNGSFAGSAIARIFIVVSQYEF